MHAGPAKLLDKAVLPRTLMQLLLSMMSQNPTHGTLLDRFSRPSGFPDEADTAVYPSPFQLDVRRGDSGNSQQ